MEPSHLRLREPEPERIALDTDFHIVWQEMQWLLPAPTVQNAQAAAQRLLAVFLSFFFWRWRRLCGAVGLLVPAFAVRPPANLALGRSFVSSSHDWYFFV